MSSGKKLSYKEKSSIHFVESAEPRFIQKLKEQLGYKCPATIEDKFESTSEGCYPEDKEQDDVDSLKKEDGPQVVVLNEGDLSQEQVDAELNKQREEEDRQKIAEGKITFKKPLKRTKDDREKSEVDIKKRREYGGKNETPNARLLSFGDEDEE